MQTSNIYATIKNIVGEIYYPQLNCPKCYQNGCENSPKKVLRFTGDVKTLQKILGDKIAISKGLTYMGFCQEHEEEMKMYGFVMAVHGGIDSDIIEEINKLSHMGRVDLKVFYEGINRLNNYVIKHLINAISCEEICSAIKLFLRYFIDSQSLLMNDYVGCIKKLNEHFTDENKMDAITLYFEMREQFKNLVFPLKTNNIFDIVSLGIKLHQTIFESKIYRKLIQ